MPAPKKVSEDLARVLDMPMPLALAAGELAIRVAQLSASIHDREHREAWLLCAKCAPDVALLRKAGVLEG